MIVATRPWQEMLPHGTHFHMLEQIHVCDAFELIALGRCAEIDHPLARVNNRGEIQLPATALIEYAAQAAGIHFGMQSPNSPSNTEPAIGLLAILRNLRATTTWLEHSQERFQVTVRSIAPLAYRFSVSRYQQSCIVGQLGLVLPQMPRPLLPHTTHKAEE